MYDWDAGKLGGGLVLIVLGLVTISVMFVVGSVRLAVLMVQAIRQRRMRHV